MFMFFQKIVITNPFFKKLFGHITQCLIKASTLPYYFALALGSLTASLSFSLFLEVPTFNATVVFCFFTLFFAGFLLKKWQIWWVFICLVGFNGVLLTGTWLAAHRLHVDETIFAPHNILLGEIDSIPSYSAHAIKFDFKVNKYCQNQHCTPIKTRLSLILSDLSYSLKKGDRVQLTAKLKKPYTYANPGSIDQERQNFLKNIQAYGRVLTIEVVKRAKLPSLRSLLLDHVKAKYADSPFQGIILALLVGDQSLVTKKQWEIFRRTGTSHLMAISGLHIGLMAGFAFMCGFYFWNCTSWAARFSAQSVACIFAMVSSIFYSYLAGWSIPTQRACIMVFLCMWVLLTRHWLSRLQIFCIALWIVLIVDPFASLRAGFWLSFFAVGILLCSSWIQSHTTWKKWIAPQLWVFVGLLPLTIFWFTEISLWSPLVNLFAIPWMSFVIVPCLFFDTILTLI
ncbi:MAG TPA: ComEC/Rec2 family competence protein, partial [Gammaproteobacteria bacterium]|nr:ComEC/Rec2 family competence protein [Gammaproteobacteria bacterium]